MRTERQIRKQLKELRKERKEGRFYPSWLYDHPIQMLEWVLEE